VTIIGPPSHPPWFCGQIPFIRIAVTDQSGFDFRFATMGTVARVEELRGISNTPASPRFPTIKPRCARRSPQNRAATVHDRANEIPLVTAERSRSGTEHNCLLAILDLDTQPPLILSHMGRKVCDANLLASVAIGPNAAPS